MSLTNTGTADNSISRFIATVQSGATAGSDPFIDFNVSGGDRYVVGIDNSDSDKFGIWENSNPGTNPRLIIDTSGNVGIGTTAPLGKLHIKDGGYRQGIILQRSGTTVDRFYGYIGDGTNSTIADEIYLDANNTNFHFRQGSTGTTETVTFLNSGNVGIGTTTPQGLLAVEQGTETYSLYIGNQGSSTPSLVVQGVNGNGNVGIGTTAPVASLHVGSTNATLRVGSDSTADASAADLQIITNDRVPTFKLTDSNVASGYITMSSNGLVFNTDTVNNYDFRTGASSADTTPETSGTSRLYIKSDGNVGIGTTAFNVGERLSVSGSDADVATFLTSAATGEIHIGGSAANDDALVVGFNKTSDYGYLQVWGDAAGSSLVIANGGNVGIGTTNPSVRLGQKLDVAASANYGGAVLSTWSATAAEASALDLSRSKSATIGTQSAVVSGDALGYITFRGSDGTNFIDGANIAATVDGTSGTNDMPTRLMFGTTADGASSITERMRITSTGNVGIGTTTPSALLAVNAPGGTDSFAIGSSTSEILRVDKDYRISLHSDASIRFRNEAGTGHINFVSKNSSDQFVLNSTLNMEQLQAAEDAGAITWFNMPVSSSASDNTPMSITYKIDNNNVFTIFG
ncbi:hypothetical protein HY629_02745, partial [Candidatus Uhrbacteria bacterium]|nr:hypothetical protein [Candidatus Uhrbacteria bacterium]